MAQNLDETKFAGLRAAKDRMAGTTVKDMFAADPGRFDRYHVALDDLVFDYSKHRVDDTVLKALFDLARALVSCRSILGEQAKDDAFQLARYRDVPGTYRVRRFH